MLLRRHKENYQPQGSILKKSENATHSIEAPGTPEATQEQTQEQTKSEIDTLVAPEVPVNQEEPSEKPDSVEETEIPEEEKKAGEKHGSAGKGKGKA